MKILLTIFSLGLFLGGCVPGEVVIEPADPVVYSTYPYDYGPNEYIVTAPIFYDEGSYHYRHHRHHHHF